MMKKLFQAISIIAGLLSLTGSVHASLILNEGESFTWSFEPQNFSFDSPWTEPDLYEEWFVSIDNISTDEIFSISVYENNLLELPFSSKSYTNSGSIGYFVSSRAVSFLDPKWTDKQGIIKIEAIRGTVGVFRADAHTILNNEYLTASIPEPNSVALLLLGAGSLYLRRKRFSNHRVELTRYNAR